MQDISGKKILFVITKSNMGGAQKYVYELACAVKDAGGIPIVALGGTGEKNAPLGALAEKLQEKNIPYYVVHNFMRNMSAKNDWGAFIELMHIIKKIRPDTLHVTSSKAGGLGALAGRLLAVKRIIFTSHGLTFQETWRPWYQRVAIASLTWFTLLLAHASIMISKETHMLASKFPFVRKKIFLVYNGIQVQQFIARENARIALIGNRATKNTLLIGGIGELHPNKNWMALLEALRELPEHIHGVIIGAGEQRTEFEQYISEHNLKNRVTLTGYKESASSLLKAFDIFVLPSKKEGLPYVLLEAGTAALPVVCSDISGNRDIITNGETGLCFQTQKELVTQLRLLAENVSLQKEYGEKLKNHIHTTFSFQNMITQTLRLY